MGSFNVPSLLGRFGKKHEEATHKELSVVPQKKILFVCTGNIARSASAVYLARYIADEGTEWIFDSAGTGAVVGAPVAPHISDELSVRGIDYSDHRAKQVTEQMVAESSLVLVMERVHLDWITREWPRYRARVHLLKQMARVRADAGRRVDPVSYMLQQDSEPLKSDQIDDPYRRGREAATRAVDEVERSLGVVVPWLGR